MMKKMDQNTIDRIKGNIQIDDIICYRSHLAKILIIEDDGCWIQGPYCEQKIDWEDIDFYNPRIKNYEPDEEEIDEEEDKGFAGYLNNLFKRAFS